MISAVHDNRYSQPVPGEERVPGDWTFSVMALLSAPGHAASLPRAGSGRPRLRLDRLFAGGGKRYFDLALGLTLLCLTSPLLLCAMLAVWLEGQGRAPVIYRQQRVGLNGERITLLKLRTMEVDAERDGPRMTARHDPRVTPLGRILRLSRLDELPQLINVLRGEMSLVGPRPERPEFVAQYERRIKGYALRHRVKPGLTGLAQISQGYTDDVEGALIKLYYDLSYIRRGSLWQDLSILMRTLPVALTGRGAR